MEEELADCSGIDPSRALVKEGIEPAMSVEAGARAGAELDTGWPVVVTTREEGDEVTGDMAEDDPDDAIVLGTQRQRQRKKMRRRRSPRLGQGRVL